MSRNAIIAEAIRELAEGQDEIKDKLSEVLTLLLDIQRVVVSLSEDQSEASNHARDNIDRLGTRVLNVERRTAALEKVVPGAAE